MRTTIRRTVALVCSAGMLGVVAAGMAAASASAHTRDDDREISRQVKVEVLSPSSGDNAGVAGAGWFVDLSVRYRGGLSAAGFTALQLTGPAAHANAAPFPGTFSTGPDDRLPGLVVLTSTTNAERPGFSGPGTNLANLFNLSGVTDRSAKGAEIWDTWIVGAPIAGVGVDTVLTVAVVADLNHDGVYNDAPAVVPDANGDGMVDARDLKTLGVASNIESVRFHLNGA